MPRVAFRLLKVIPPFSSTAAFTAATLATTLAVVKAAVDENGGMTLDDLEATLGMNATIGLSDEQSEQIWSWDDKKSTKKIGLSDEQSEQIWSWDDKNPSTFRNWGPNEPSGAGDGAVMYPNQWTHSDCNEKKRFLCQARVPSCRCRTMTFMNRSPPLNRCKCAEEAAGVFNREFWANNYADIVRTRTQVRLGQVSLGEETYSDWDFPGQTQTNLAFPRCGFVFPTKWSDVDVNLGGSESSGQTLLPAFFCKRFAPEIKNNDTENPLALSDVNNNADTYL
ncbi:unnamed protein product [Notodromas monacha]|uniref:C-type lectin domain-containing protein n=1 Tax=Notodromas monacha TaxID=399045 RepID=A0A7R9BLW6_9CRUS|nr:unnamed protein product [Notodromas monacha]CAG0917626.1 unnamed protein product [Notodromas monacha]